MRKLYEERQIWICNLHNMHYRIIFVYMLNMYECIVMAIRHQQCWLNAWKSYCDVHGCFVGNSVFRMYCCSLI